MLSVQSPIRTCSVLTSAMPDLHVVAVFFFFFICFLFAQEVPDELWELLELEKLNLSLNNLKFLPPQLALLSNLVVLNLWGNQVRHVSE